MNSRSNRHARVGGAVAAALLAVSAAGCTGGDPLARAGVALKPPAGWTPVARTTWPVAGVPLAAWSGPGGSSLVVARALPYPGGTAAALTRATVVRMENLPGVRVVGSGTEVVGGGTAARVDVSAPGTGDALAPSGRGVPTAPGGKALRPTRRVVVSLVRPSDTLELVWHAPESEAEALTGQVRATLQTLSVRGGSPAAQSY